MTHIQLNNGLNIPLLGYGGSQIDDVAQCEQAVLAALQTGYRLIDTAACYGNEAAVGRALAKAGVPRAEVFLTSKGGLQTAGYAGTMAAFDRTLANLQTDYLDLYLLHLPDGDYHGSWRAMEELYRAGKIRALGVCNFLPDRLVDLIETHTVVPTVNQIELHPFAQRRGLRAMLAKYRITPMTWAPFAEGQPSLLTDPTLTTIGAQYGKTAAQVTLRWLAQSGIVALPKSVHLARIRENFASANFQLTPTDLARIAKLDRHHPLLLDVATPAPTHRRSVNGG